MIDAAFMSHVIFWFLGAMSLLGVIGVTGAMYAMARHRKD